MASEPVKERLTKPEVRTSVDWTKPIPFREDVETAGFVILEETNAKDDAHKRDLTVRLFVASELKTPFSWPSGNEKTWVLIDVQTSFLVGSDAAYAQAFPPAVEGVIVHGKP